MKKTLIALAAVASTAAFAQSTVTLSGTVDTGLQKAFSGDPLKAVASRNGTSNWTISGAEDLGGGLKATFKVSTSFNSDDGTLAGAVLGNNDMYVGLEGGFGAVRLGRSFDPVFSHALTANGTKGVTGYNSVGNTLNNRGVYVPNQVLYITPNFSGFQGTVSYAPSEVAGQSAHTGFGLRYAAGPLALTLASSKAAGVNLKNVTQIGAAYDFGVARVLFTWQDNGNNPSASDNGWALGVTAPVGPGLVYASYDVKELAGKDGRILLAGYKYFLSKRTTVYANIANANSSWNLAGTGKSTTGYGFGIQHNF